MEVDTDESICRICRWTVTIKLMYATVQLMNANRFLMNSRDSDWVFFALAWMVNADLGMESIDHLTSKVRTLCLFALRNRGCQIVHWFKCFSLTNPLWYVLLSAEYYVICQVIKHQLSPFNDFRFSPYHGDIHVQTLQSRKLKCHLFLSITYLIKYRNWET